MRLCGCIFAPRRIIAQINMGTKAIKTTQTGSGSILHRGTGFQPVFEGKCKKEPCFSGVPEVKIAHTGWKPVPVRLRVYPIREV